MRFGWLTLHNFCRTRHLRIDLSKKGITWLRGKNLDVGASNESGKSTIPRGISWILFDKFPDGPGKPGDSIVNPLENHDCYGELEVFDDNSELIVAKRTRMEGPKHKDSKFYLTYKGETKEIDLTTREASSAKLVFDTLGFDYETFHKQYVFAQDGVEPITRMKDAGLKQFFLENVLNIEWTKLALEKAKDDKKRIESLIEDCKYQKKSEIEKIRISARKIKEYKQKMLVWADQQDKEKQELKDELKETVDLMKKAKTENKKIETKITKLKKELSAIKFANHDEEIEKLEKEYRAAQVAEIRVADTVKRNKDKIERLNNNITQAEDRIGKPCPSCGTMLTKKHLPFFIGETRSEIDTLENLVAEDTLTKAEAKKRSELILQSLKASKEKREGEASKRDEQTKLKLTLKDVESELISLEDIQEEIDKIEKRIKAKEDVENPFVEMWNEEKETIGKRSDAVKRLNAKRMSHYDEMKLVDFWVKGFSSGGVQSFLLDGITPTINRNIAKYMGDLANNRIAVRIHTVKKLKSGEYRENFHIEVANMDGSNSFVSLSGGAKRRVDLAVSLAVADFRRSLGHRQLKFLVLDESTAFLDQHWEERFYKMVRKNFSDFACFIITHKDIDPNMVDHVVTVVKENGETKIEKAV